MLNGLDLFSGIGGLSLALGPWVRPIAYCENERFAQAVLLSRMRDGSIPLAPIWDDVRTLLGPMVPEVDIIYGGFPCQDISLAGRGGGLEGKRSGLVFEVFRLIDELSPPFVFMENVPPIRTRGAERVGKELSSRGYDCRWGIVSAQEVGAPHLRNRWFLLAANPKRLELRDKSGRERRSSREKAPRPSDDGYPKGWKTMPELCGMGDGVPARMDRIRALGNACVPLQAQTAFKRLMGLK